MSAHSHPNHTGDPTPEEPMNTPDRNPVNTPDTPDMNTGQVTPVNGNVVPFTPRPDTAATPEEIPAQERRVLVRGEVIDAEIVDDDARVRPVPVDPPEVSRTWWETIGDATARPLLAEWVTSAEEFGSRAKYLARYAAHTVAFHALRVPKYVPTAFLRSFGAIGRLVARLHRWVYDAESKPVRMAARDRADAAEYMKLREARNETVRKRLLPVYLGILLTIAIVYVCITCLPAAANWALLISLMC
jgi:S-DNA-T family DNA segregation ATPase FtsK/SpoIIIE